MSKTLHQFYFRKAVIMFKRINRVSLPEAERSVSVEMKDGKVFTLINGVEIALQ